MRADWCKGPQEDFSERSHRPVSIWAPSVTSGSPWASHSIPLKPFFSSRISGLFYPTHGAVVRSKWEDSVNFSNRGTYTQRVWLTNRLHPLYKLHSVSDWEIFSRWSYDPPWVTWLINDKDGIWRYFPPKCIFFPASRMNLSTVGKSYQL